MTAAVRDPQRRGRMIFGAANLMVALGYLIQALGMPRGTAEHPGPGLWPIAVGMAWVVISLLVIAEAAVSREVGGQIDLPTGVERRNVLMFLGATITFVVLLPFLGQYIAASLYAIAIIKLLSSLSWARAVAYGVVLGAGISFAFISLLQIRLPVGLFGGF
ncbi:tripartite tricarboxylate transporter TctB family protein [Mycobacterium neglectum]|uniref:tripartite tricarboxylate transporter TctB family protein n=1 Tax=Mycobacterium neglectum TaxID=242737 RepID=UPI001FE7A88F|nr:tripartite tricarboxylate transporter TctB family protein [Mycobacterium neglectum]